MHIGFLVLRLVEHACSWRAYIRTVQLQYCSHCVDCLSDSDIKLFSRGVQLDEARVETERAHAIARRESEKRAAAIAEQQAHESVMGCVVVLQFFLSATPLNDNHLLLF